MSKYLYSATHEWALIEGKKAKMGISKFASDELGDIVFVNLPVVGAKATAGKALCEVESVKAVSDIIAPVNGVVKSVNKELEDAPEKINEDPMNAWICEIETDSDSGADKLMSEFDYLALTKKA